MDLEEFMHITISVLTISFAFAYIFQPTPDFTYNFLLVLITVGPAFLLHELAHKFVAQKYGCYAVYRAWTLGLAFAVFSAVFLGFVFAAPGAVYIFGPHLTREQNGKIGLSGPLTNLLLALGFIALGIIIPQAEEISSVGAYVNAFLGTFNALPFAPMDGEKILKWNKIIWVTLFGTLLLLSVILLFK